MLVGPQVIDPELLSPRILAGWPPVEEKNVCLDALGIENPCRKPQQRMNIALLEELAPDSLACATLEEHVVGNNYGRPPVYLEQRLNVLQEVELLV